MRITSATARPDFRLALVFEGGAAGEVDLSSFAGRGVFAAWLQPGVFEQVRVTTEGAVEWPGEIDLCSDALYLRMTGKQPDELYPSLQGRLSHA
jgi:Protein of unknown function (DUF2442)